MWNYIKGEIVLDISNNSWSQFIDETDGEVRLYNGISYRNSRIDDIQKAVLPLALDALGFKFKVNKKGGGTKFKHNGHIINLWTISTLYVAWK